MLTKYIILFYIITPNLNSLSIRKDIDMAKELLKFHGIQDPELCKEERVTKLCSNNYYTEVCSARLFRKKMEFKQFDNPCYMELNNFCESQDNIWAIKNDGPCIMNTKLRRYAKEIEKMVKKDINSTDSETEDAETTTTGENDDTDETSPDDEIEDVTEALRKEEDETPDEATDEEVTEASPDDNETTDDATDDPNDALRVADETTVAGESDSVTEQENNAEDENATEDTNSVDPVVETTLSIDEIGKIFYDDGSVKAALRVADAPTRFPPTRAKMTYNKVPCAKRIKPCPDLYYPVCLYYAKEKPNNVTYYYFVNSCEAQQYTCFHPEHKIEGSSSVRAGYCAHIQYINYARFVHTMSAWGHYGWLHGPWPFNHILKPHERA